MRIMANQHIRRLILSLGIVLIVFTILLQVGLWMLYGKISVAIVLLSLSLTAVILLFCMNYFQTQDKSIESAESQISRFLSGDHDARIDCDEEGELFRLFQSVNTLSSVLNAQAEREKQRNEFLKNTISDISHQLKTPIAALNIYNGLIADTDNAEDIRHFTQASEAELNRMENLVKNLLKLTRLDSGEITPEKHPENLADIMTELWQRFSIRAEQEGKEICLEGGDDILECDAAWLSEALSNLIKNALDHTQSGDIVTVKWKQQGGMQRIMVEDSGCGIHPEDIHYIFKRFYRSCFSQDKQGIGLGLSLAKAIVESQGGTIEVESELGRGTVFSINFMIPTKV